MTPYFNFKRQNLFKARVREKWTDSLKSEGLQEKRLVRTGAGHLEMDVCGVDNQSGCIVEREEASFQKDCIQQSQLKLGGEKGGTCGFKMPVEGTAGKEIRD